MTIVKTDNYEELLIKDEQTSLVLSPDKIQMALKLDNCFGFYAKDEQVNIGFALVRQYAVRQFFLWDFIIDYRYQGLGNGKKFLRLLIDTLRKDYLAEDITTTYIYGNETARNLYESLGFVTTDIARDGNVHEVNMTLSLRNP